MHLSFINIKCHYLVAESRRDFAVKGCIKSLEKVLLLQCFDFLIDHFLIKKTCFWSKFDQNSAKFRLKHPYFSLEMVDFRSNFYEKGVFLTKKWFSSLKMLETGLLGLGLWVLQYCHRFWIKNRWTFDQNSTIFRLRTQYPYNLIRNATFWSNFTKIGEYSKTEDSIFKIFIHIGALWSFPLAAARIHQLANWTTRH